VINGDGANSFTNTYVGNVLQGSLTNPVTIFGNGAYNCVGSMVPLGGSLTNLVTGYAASDGDNLNVWNPDTFDFLATIPQYSTFTHAWNVDYTGMAPAVGFFIIRSGSTDVPWVRSFTVQ